MQVSKNSFDVTQTTSSSLKTLIDNIETHYGIVWSSVEWEDLRKPLYSALAARLYLSTVSAQIPVIGDLDGQASYWKMHYDTDDGTREDYFKQRLANCEGTKSN